MRPLRLLLCVSLALFSMTAFAADSAPAARAYVWTMDGCRPCARMEPAVNRLYAEGWEINFVDAAEHHDQYEAWGIQGTPTIQVVRDGKEVARALGYQTEEALCDLLKRCNVRRRKP